MWSQDRCLLEHRGAARGSSDSDATLWGDSDKLHHQEMSFNSHLEGLGGPRMSSRDNSASDGMWPESDVRSGRPGHVMCWALG